MKEAFLGGILGLIMCHTAFTFGKAQGQQETKQIVIYKQPTDDQLMAWWFGEGDKSSLRERICK